MINTSNEYKQVVRGDERQFYAGAKITLIDGTVLNLDNSKIKNLKVEDSVSQSDKFTIGGAVINKLTLQINNMDDAYSDYDFTGAIVRPSVGLQLSSTIETLPKGVFVADDPKVIGASITLTALDNMAKFDRPFSEISAVFPINAGSLLSFVCVHCGVILATTTFPNNNYIIQNRPDDEAISCREVVSWIAQLGGNFARCNTSGALEIKWYDIEAFEHTPDIDGGYFDGDTPYSSGDSVDGGNFTNYSSGDSVDGGTFIDQKRYHHIYFHYSNPTVAVDDVVITGIKVTDTAEAPNTAFYGQEGYVISIEGNQFIQSQSDASQVVNFVGAKIVGMRFRPLTATVKSDPSIEAGDIAFVSTRKGVAYQTLITNTSFGVHQQQRISCDAESPLRNSSTRFTETSKAIVESRKMVQSERTAREQAIQHLAEELANSSGLYITTETLPDDSKIYYMHDKSTLEESMIVWKLTANAFGISTDGGVTYPYGLDVNGDAILNKIYAIGIDATYLTLGKLYSKDGSVLVDLDYGVANSDNFSFIDNIQDGYPLTMPFNIDDSVSKINKVLLKFTQQKFRTYSTTANSGGGSSVTSASGGGATQTSSTQDGEIRSTSGAGAHTHDVASSGFINLTTNEVAPPTGVPHYHSVVGSISVGTSIGSVYEHYHTVNWPSHNHTVLIPSHTHGVSIPNHTHTLDFGVKETDITNNEIKIYVDGTLRATTSDLQGIVDLTAWVTTVGWHEIEIRSTALKRVSAQINIKSYIRS